MSGALVFLIFGTAKTLSWNSVARKDELNGLQLNEPETTKPLKNSPPV